MYGYDFPFCTAKIKIANQTFITLVKNISSIFGYYYHHYYYHHRLIDLRSQFGHRYIQGALSDTSQVGICFCSIQFLFARSSSMVFNVKVLYTSLFSHALLPILIIDYHYLSFHFLLFPSSYQPSQCWVRISYKDILLAHMASSLMMMWESICEMIHYGRNFYKIHRSTNPQLILLYITATTQG